MTELEARNKLIETATKEIGYTEQGKNITKYAHDFDTKYPTFYNTKKQGAEWCDLWYDWTHVTSFGEETARRMLYQPVKSAGAGCKFSAGYYKQNKAFYSKPQTGDQIFFYVGGEINHTGMVVAVSGSQVVTIEGNSNNAVRKNYYSIADGHIAGYGRPNWSLVADKPQPTPTPTPTGETCMIEMQVLSFGSVGEQVKTMQIMLNSKGFKGANNKQLTVDGQFGSNSVHALKQAQQAWNMNPDGICGQKSWSRLLKG